MSAAEVQTVAAGMLGDHLADCLRDGGRRHPVYQRLQAVRAEVREGNRPGMLEVKIIYEERRQP